MGNKTGHEELLDILVFKIKVFCKTLNSDNEKMLLKEMLAIKELLEKGVSIKQEALNFLESLSQEAREAIKAEVALFKRKKELADERILELVLNEKTELKKLRPSAWEIAWQRYFKEREEKILDKEISLLRAYGFNSNQAKEIALAADVQHSEKMILWLQDLIRVIKASTHCKRTEKQFLDFLEIIFMHVNIDTMSISKVMEFLKCADYPMPNCEGVSCFFIFMGAKKAISYGFLPRPK